LARKAPGSDSQSETELIGTSLNQSTAMEHRTDEKPATGQSHEKLTQLSSNPFIW
jgi:hypothetical protein